MMKNKSKMNKKGMIFVVLMLSTCLAMMGCGKNEVQSESSETMTDTRRSEQESQTDGTEDVIDSQIPTESVSQEEVEEKNTESVDNTEGNAGAGTKPTEHMHKSSDWVIDKAASCTAEGTKHKECVTCREVLETGSIAKAKHTEVKIPSKAATKTECGQTEGKKCSVCDAVLVAPQKVPATGSVGLEYAVNEDGKSCTIVGVGTCKDKHIIIPAEIDGYKVESITLENSSFDFDDVNRPTKLTMQDGVKDIDFTNCGWFEEVHFSATVSEISVSYAEFRTVTVDEENPNFYVAGNCLIDARTKSLVTIMPNCKIPTDGSVTGTYEFCHFSYGRYEGDFWSDDWEAADLAVPGAVKHVDFFCCDFGTLTLEEGVETFWGLGSGYSALYLPASLKELTLSQLYDEYNDRVYYAGTVAQWKELEKNTGFMGVDVTVHCSDGDVVTGDGFHGIVDIQ